MTMIGTVIRYIAPNGDRVSALCYDERADLPHFDIEIVNSEGEVTEHFIIRGSYALDVVAQRRGWEERQ